MNIWDKNDAGSHLPVAVLRKGAVMTLLAATLALGGCAGAGLTVLGAGAGAAAGAGVDYTLNGIAYKTFTASADDVHRATRNTLGRMGMKIADDRKTKEGFSLHAVAEDRNIYIDLEHVTGRTTRMRVDVDKGDIFKDRATATEIIVQASYVLDRQFAHR